uniref:Uncharacterized protein n=1 Tax=Arundo donax TaxID=35708 RepID=A0A0A9HLY2_ARUDO
MLLMWPTKSTSSKLQATALGICVLIFCEREFCSYFLAKGLGGSFTISVLMHTYEFDTIQVTYICL